MIDLGRTRAEFLQEIEAPDLVGDPLSDVTDWRVATMDVHVRLCGHGREDLFPLLKLALSERFAAVPRSQLVRDLLKPLKNALGNAYKHGNGRDLTKTVGVEIVLTRRGTLIAVTDQGTGFDTALTFRRFLEQQNYFENHGEGFRNLHRAMSTVSYENGGRTVLLCFRHTDDPDGMSFYQPASAADTRPQLLASGWIKDCLSDELPEFGNGRAKLESCRVYAPRGYAGDDCGNRYVLRVAAPDRGLAGTRIFTGRLHSTEAAAETDFEAATRLFNAGIWKGVLIPRPVARLDREPRLVLYEFDSWMNLWEYLSYRRSLKAVRHSAERIGVALARVHGCAFVTQGKTSDLPEERIAEMIGHAQRTPHTELWGPPLMTHFQVLVQRIQQRSSSTRTPTPIHGAFGWDCIHYGVDGRFYLYRFEGFRRSDPGFDLGGFAADLLCFTLATYDEEAYRVCRDEFLRSYNSKAELPVSESDLHFYTALALLQRLQNVEFCSRIDARQLVRALDTVLRSETGVATS